jgi:hypothetical protein
MMNKHTAHTLTTAALRALDPAPKTVLTEAELERADATFARILATPSHDPVTTKPDRPRRRRSRLLVPVGLAGAAGAAIPALLLGGSAYGSWTPTPEPLTATDAGAAVATCRAALGVPDQKIRDLITERRGEWTYVLIAGSEGEGACLMPNDLVGQDAAADRGAFFGTYDPATDVVDAPTLARDRIVEIGSMEGSTDEGWFSWTHGYVGRDVTGVTVHPPSGPDVEASVDGGRFAAWWPEANPGATEASTYTVSLADGSTRPATG